MPCRWHFVFPHWKEFLLSRFRACALCAAMAVATAMTVQTRAARLERATFSLVGRCSIQLSYARRWKARPRPPRFGPLDGHGWWRWRDLHPRADRWETDRPRLPSPHIQADRPQGRSAESLDRFLTPTQAEHKDECLSRNKMIAIYVATKYCAVCFGARPSQRRHRKRIW
jgi:hypothetical protein